MSEERANEEYPRCTGSGDSEPCITGYWSDAYNGSIFCGADIRDYYNGNETIVFRFCPMCGRKLPSPNATLQGSPEAQRKEDNVEHLVGLLESRHTAMLEWVEPWPACGPDGSTLDAHITLRATVHDCINLQRAADRQAGRPTMGDDERRLDEFMVVHWATVVQPNGKDETQHDQT